MNRNNITKAIVLAVSAAKVIQKGKMSKNNSNKIIEEFNHAYNNYAHSSMVKKTMYYIMAGFGENLEYDMIGTDHKITFDAQIFEDGGPSEGIVLTISNARKTVTLEFEQAIGTSVIEWKGEVMVDIDNGHSHVHITSNGQPSMVSPLEIKKFINELIHYAHHPVNKKDFKSDAFAAALQMLADSPTRNRRNICKILAAVEAKNAMENAAKMEAESKAAINAAAEKLFEERKKGFVAQGTFNEVRFALEKAREELDAVKRELNDIKAEAAQQIETTKKTTKIKKGNNNSSTK